MSALADLADDQLALLLLTPAMEVWTPKIGASRLGRVLSRAGAMLTLAHAEAALDAARAEAEQGLSESTGQHLRLHLID